MIKLDELKKSFKFQSNYELLNYLDLNLEDSLQILSVRNSPTVRSMMSNSNLISEQEHFNFIEKLKNRNEGYWVLKKDKEILGGLSLVNFEKENNSFIGGNFIIPEKIGSGFGLVINYFMHLVAFDKISCNCIQAYVKKDNINALKVNMFFGAISLNQGNLTVENKEDYLFKQFLQDNWTNKIKVKAENMLKYVF